MDCAVGKRRRKGQTTRTGSSSNYRAIQRNVVQQHTMLHRHARQRDLKVSVGEFLEVVGDGDQRIIICLNYAVGQHRKYDSTSLIVLICFLALFGPNPSRGQLAMYTLAI
jgi:hypothetical protein